MQMKASFEDNYLDHLSNLNIHSKSSQNTLTTLACGVREYKYKYSSCRLNNFFLLLLQYQTSPEM